MEPRKARIRSEPASSCSTQGHGVGGKADCPDTPPGSWSSASQQQLSAREPGDLEDASPPMVGGRQGREGDEPQDEPACFEKSDKPMVPEKSTNSRVTPEESMEERGEADGKFARGNADGTLRPNTRAYITERIGTRARKDKGVRFNNLLSHLRLPLLREAYQALRKKAAAGVDGETWSSYGVDLDARLQDLEERIHRGNYHPLPVRRVHIPKGDGTSRPLGIPALEDKIVQQAVRWIIEPIYEPAFLGFSYGFRPRRSAHDALDALDKAIGRKLNWVLDADLRSFFDTIEAGWMQRFLEHRITDRRMVRLLMKWMRAGVMEDGKFWEAERGAPQGGIISPLMANVYLHYVLDLWAHHWRRRPGHGEVYIVRYADDLVMGFQYESDGRAMLAALAARLVEFGLELHPEKTRLIRFGRFAERDCRLDGNKRPLTFDFLGFTHICAQSRVGKFKVVRRTSRKKRHAKLKKLREEIWRARHDPVTEQHSRLNSVLRGHYEYYGVPDNYRALRSFRFQLCRAWHRALQYRSQRGRWTRERLKQFDRKLSLLPPRITRRHRQLSLPLTGGGSPVREIRTPGSVRGAG